MSAAAASGASPESVSAYQIEKKTANEAVIRAMEKEDIHRKKFQCAVFPSAPPL